MASVDHSINFKYFQAPEDNILDFDFGYRAEYVKDGDAPPPPCSFCGQRVRCQLIRWDSTHEEGLTVYRGDPENAWEPDVFLRRCLDCLRAGRFPEYHFTEAGEIIDGRLAPRGEFNAAFTNEAISELARTPSFGTFQQALWMTHCDDFMAYLGEWGQEEFSRAAPDGDGAALFSTVEQSPDSFGTEEWEELRGYGLYLFRCLHCGKLRSFSDWD